VVESSLQENVSVLCALLRAPCALYKRLYSIWHYELRVLLLEYPHRTVM
jgi:hypothetical protein